MRAYVYSCEGFHQVIYQKEWSIKLRINNGGWHETLNLLHVSRCEMLHFVTSYMKQNKRQTLRMRSMDGKSAFNSLHKTCWGSPSNQRFPILRIGETRWLIDEFRSLQQLICSPNRMLVLVSAVCQFWHAIPKLWKGKNIKPLPRNTTEGSLGHQQLESFISSVTMWMYYSTAQK